PRAVARRGSQPRGNAVLSGPRTNGANEAPRGPSSRPLCIGRHFLRDADRDSTLPVARSFEDRTRPPGGPAGPAGAGGWRWPEAALRSRAQAPREDAGVALPDGRGARERPRRGTPAVGRFRHHPAVRARTPGPPRARLASQAVRQRTRDRRADRFALAVHGR